MSYTCLNTGVTFIFSYRDISAIKTKVLHHSNLFINHTDRQLILQFTVFARTSKVESSAGSPFSAVHRNIVANAAEEFLSTTLILLVSLNQGGNSFVRLLIYFLLFLEIVSGPKFVQISDLKNFLLLKCVEKAVN